MKKIPLPYTFSDSTVQAFKFAVEWAPQSKGEVTLLHVIKIPVMHDNVMTPTCSFEEPYLQTRVDKGFYKMKSKWAKDGPKGSTLSGMAPYSKDISRFAKKKQWI